MPQIESMQRLDNDSALSMRKAFQTVDGGMASTHHDSFLRDDHSWLKQS